MIDVKQHSLLAHNTFGIDVLCKRFMQFDSEAELADLLRRLEKADYPVMPLGEGSNLLLTKDFDGTVICSNIQTKSLEIDAEHQATLHCGSGVNWDKLVAFCVENGAYGLENLSLIPGTVGAAVVQNIGAYGIEVKDFVHTITAIEVETGETRLFSREDCCYAYRFSRFKADWKHRYIITHVTLKWDCSYRPCLDYGVIRAELVRQSIANPTPEELRQTIIAIRNAKLPDPKNWGNAGSFFMNPIISTAKYEELVAQNPVIPYYIIDKEHVKIPAGWLIEQCGWKGKAQGRAGVYEKQALVLVNLGGATGQEIVQLCQTIQQDVYNRFGIAIEPEVNIL